MPSSGTRHKPSPQPPCSQSSTSYLGDRHPLLQLLPEPRHSADHLLVAGDDVVESDPTVRTDQAAIQLEVATDPLVAMVAVDQGEVHRFIPEPLGHLVTRPRVVGISAHGLESLARKRHRLQHGKPVGLIAGAEGPSWQVDREQLGIAGSHPAEQEERPSLRRADLEH